MLSFTKGEPIARIVGGKYDGKRIRLIRDIKKKNKCCNKCQGGCLTCGGRCCDLCFENFISEVGNKLKGEKLDPKDPLYFIQQEINKKKLDEHDEIKIDDATDIIPLPQKKYNEEQHQTDALYVAGPKGSGKSTYISKYTKEFKRMFPNRKIYLFSRKPKDEELDKIKGLTRIVIDEDLVENPVTDLSGFKKSLVIFDDIDTITDKSIKDAVFKLLEDMLKTGRSEDIYVALTNHQITEYKKTRDFLNESNFITIFPQASSSNGITNLFKHYGGWGTKDVQKVLSLPSRWVTLHKSFPQYILHEGGAYLLNRKIDTKKV